jgi:Glyoxalase-like domain
VAACTMTELDHITVAAHTLEQGLAHVRAILGIEMPHGGAHPRMGTHNHLLRLGDALFLELIAIDPSAPAPARPRWFQLDDPALQAELRSAPRLLTWVVRTHRIAETFLACNRPLGAIEPMERGGLRWLITFPNDGTLVDGGMMPSVIQWPEGAHPASRMPDLGYTLDRLEVAHPDPASYRRDLASIGADRHVEIRAITPASRPHLVAHIRTPAGVRTLR